MEICEQASGARMHTALYRPFAFDFSVLSTMLLRELGHFLTRCSRSLAGAFLGLLNNRGLKSRLSFIGQVTLSKVTAYGVTGLISRSCGGFYDLRFQNHPGYTLYRGWSFRMFIGRRGDNLDRFLLRVKEVAESFRLLSQALQALFPTTPRHSGVACLPVNVKSCFLFKGARALRRPLLDVVITKKVASAAVFGSHLRHRHSLSSPMST